jgi:mono/diheme cytochrome c family protein
MLRIILIILGASVVVTVIVAGWRGQTSTRPPLRAFDDMHDQPRYNPQADSPFFADGRTMRPVPAGSVPWGRSALAADARHLMRDEQNFAAQELPFDITRDLLNRGQRQYGVYCIVCHDATGTGNGITTQYGMINPPSLHTDRARQMSPGELYQIITQGRGLMGPYGEKVEPDDRWAIIAYVWALQRAHAATIEDVPERLRPQLEAN